MSTSKPRVRIDVPLWIATRPESGEEWIVRDDTYFNEVRAVTLQDMERGLKSRKSAGDTDENQAIFRKSYIESLDEKVAEAKAVHAAAKKFAVRRDFVLLRPTYRQFLEAKGKANIQDEYSGDARFDPDVFTQEILYSSVEGYEGNDFLDDPDISPQVASELARILQRAVSQQDTRLPFLSSPSETH